jgi:hypothetical protein
LGHAPSPWLNTIFLIKIKSRNNHTYTTHRHTLICTQAHIIKESDTLTNWQENFHSRDGSPFPENVAYRKHVWNRFLWELPLAISLPTLTSHYSWQNLVLQESIEYLQLPPKAFGIKTKNMVDGKVACTTWTPWPSVTIS